MFKSSGGIQNLTLMKMLVLTVNFMVESEATIETNIQCCLNDDYDEKECHIMVNRFEREKEKNKIYEFIQQFRAIATHKRLIDDIYNDERNKKMGENKLTRDEIECIYLFAWDKFNTQIKNAHRRGETCSWRYMSLYIINGLKKLKKYEKERNHNVFTVV